MDRVLIIAEAGVNHNGNVELARNLISTAKDCGADIVKFQTWITEELVVKDAPKASYQIVNDASGSQYEMLKKLELSFNDFKGLKKYADDIGIDFLSTPDEEKSLNFLVDELGMQIIKVGSGDVSNIPFLAKIGKKRLPVIMSTGMSYLGEVEKAYFTLIENGAPEVTILHCTSNYPASYPSVNLNAMITIRDALKTKIGYSDHTIGIEISIAAVALGARIIEKHFTLDKSLQGPDHKSSMNPDEFKLLVKKIRNVEAAISGDGKKIPTKEESEIKNIVQKGIYFNDSINAGAVITIDSLCFKRPVGNAISAADFTFIVGKTLKRDVKKGEIVTLNCF
jgi:N-acetylneuraminate synthase/N,N'-diacetyllegionaminate synthase